MLTLEDAAPAVQTHPPINAPLLRRVMVHIKANPESWNQDEWLKQDPMCGTVACLAGWTYVLATGRTDAPKNEGDIATIAQCWLGLTAEQAEELFWLTDVRDRFLSRNRHPTFEEFAERVTAVTGVDLKDIVGASA